MTYELVRWQKYGHDRLYMNSGQRKIGWIDLKTGRATSTTDQGWPHPCRGDGEAVAGEQRVRTLAR